jgi:hypothetical protein
MKRWSAVRTGATAALAAAMSLALGQQIFAQQIQVNKDNRTIAISAQG